MPTSITSLGVTFPDNSVQTTAPIVIGIGQTYSTSSKSFGTVYTNTGTKPILVSVVGFTTAGSGYSDMSLLVNGARIQYFDHAPDASGILHFTVSAIIPIGNTYQVTATNITLVSWIELS